MVLVRLAGAVGSLGGAAWLLGRSAPRDWPASVADVPRWLVSAPADERVVSLAVVAAYACLVWLAVVLGCVAAGAFPRGHVRDLAERVLGVAVVGVAAGALVAGPALAADGPFDRPAGPAPPPCDPAAAAAGGVRATAGPGHVVAPGDTLWSIAARRLRRSASPALIAATWPRWYAANRPRVGPDPAVIRPGQRLVAPKEAAR